MIKKLIVNADDYGFTEGCNQGILKAYQEGIVTSTTVMMNYPHVNEALTLLNNTSIGLGVHLNTTKGQPLTVCPSLVENNQFKNRFHYTNINKEELYKEWKAQIELFIKYTGHLPDHLDSHHHIHLREEYRDILLKLIHEYHLPVRQREYINNDCYVYDQLNASNMSLEHFKDICETHNSILEIMVHPAYSDDLLRSISSYSNEREIELNFLINKKIKEYIKENNIELITYRDVKSKD